MYTVLITGGTGLIGKALTKMLVEKGHDVIILSRSAKSSNESHVKYAAWDVQKQRVDEQAIAAADFIVHLAGAGVADKRWSKSRKKEIVDSRTLSSSLLVKALQTTPNKVKAVISASAIGWYGDDKQRPLTKKMFTEDMPASNDFLGETCKLWEQSIEPVKALGIRLVKLRTGIVLSNDGGAFSEFKKPIKLGLAAILGNGQQVISWIHIEDMCRLYLFAMENNNVTGVYNAVAPTPVKNKPLTLLLAKKIKGNFFLPINIPSFALNIIMGEMSIEVLKSATVSSSKITEAGFTCVYPSIELAISELTYKP